MQRYGLSESGAGTAVLDPPREKRGSSRRRSPPARPGGGGPPRPPDFGGGGGGGGKGDGEARNDPPEGSAEIGFAFLLLSISTLFIAFLGAYLFLRRAADVWPPPGSPVAPDGLWISTAVLAVSSLVLGYAPRERRRGHAAAARRWLVLTIALGAFFLGVQAWLWRGLFDRGLTTDSNAYGALFYSLTGLHALHVIGGLVFLGCAAIAAAAAARSPRKRTLIEFAAIYWHFIGVLWLVLFAVLYLG